MECLGLEVQKKTSKTNEAVSWWISAFSGGSVSRRKYKKWSRRILIGGFSVPWFWFASQTQHWTARATLQSCSSGPLKCFDWRQPRALTAANDWQPGGMMALQPAYGSSSTSSKTLAFVSQCLFTRLATENNRGTRWRESWSLHSIWVWWKIWKRIH